jgi:hypothetical protein
VDIQASQEHTTTPKLHDRAFDLLERDLNAFLSCDYVVLIHVLSSLLVCVVLLQLCSCLCFYLPPYSIFDCDQLCKVWETPICGDSSQLGNWYKEDNCVTQVLYLDHLRGVECNPWPKKVTTTWSKHWPNHGKNRCVSYPFYLLRLLSYWVLIFTNNIAPKFNIHPKGAIKWRVLFSPLSSS